MEARAAPRLINVEGLWRRSTGARPGTMTEFIRGSGLLPPLEIDAIVNGAPVALVEFQAVAAQFPVEARPPPREWIDRSDERRVEKEGASLCGNLGTQAPSNKQSHYIYNHTYHYNN